MAKVLAGLALQKTLRCDIRLHSYCQATQLSWQANFLTNLGASSHPIDEMWCQGTVLLDIVVAKPLLVRYDSLNGNVQGFQLLRTKPSGMRLTTGAKRPQS